MWLNVPLSCPNPHESYPDPNISTGNHVWVTEVETDPDATGSMLARDIGRENAWSTISPVTSRMRMPKDQSPDEGGVNHTLLGEGMLLPAVMSNTTESEIVLLTKASTVTSRISKNALDPTSISICTLSSRPSPSLSKGDIVSMETSAGSVIRPACTVTDAVG